MQPSLQTRRQRYLLLTLAGIQFSHILDFMIMMPLGPMLIDALGIGAHDFGLLVASYSLTAAISGLLAASFIDRFERKAMLLSMFALFGLASLACALAPGYESLLMARGMAGAFGGVMGAMVQTIIADVVPFERRGRASGVVMSAFSVSTIAGVPLSLWLANHFGWRAPFLLIALLTLLFLFISWRVLPPLSQHLSRARGAHPLADIFAVLRDTNHRRALLFGGLIIFSGFTVIPYITIYTVANVGVSQLDIPLIYLAGGAATLVSARLVGRWADRFGKVVVYRLVASLALLPLLLVTQAGAMPLWAWMLCTTLFFVMVSGRMIPAMAIITAAAQSGFRGTFMSLFAASQQLASSLASWLAGLMVVQSSSGQLLHYEWVGYVAMAANVLAILFVSRIVIRDQRPLAVAAAKP